MEAQTQPPKSDRRYAIRSAIFFWVFATAMLAFGCWMSYRFSLGEDASHHLRSLGIMLGVAAIASAILPARFAILIVRQLNMFQRLS